MKVLIDECAPKALKTFLIQRGHESSTVQEAGWAGGRALIPKNAFGSPTLAACFLQGWDLSLVLF